MDHRDPVYRSESELRARDEPAKPPPNVLGVRHGRVCWVPWDEPSISRSVAEYLERER